MRHRYVAIVLGVVAVVVAIVVGVIAYGVVTYRNEQERDEYAGQATTLSLASPVFLNNGTIPARYTADGANLSPPLQWQGAPAGTLSFAILVEDPDAPGGVFVHWLIADMPASVNALPEGIPAQDVVSGPVAAVQGSNGFRKTGYGGPQPPAGKPHRYIFRLYAVDGSLDMSGQFTKSQFRAAIAKRVLAEATLVGLYGRDK